MGLLEEAENWGAGKEGGGDGTRLNGEGECGGGTAGAYCGEGGGPAGAYFGEGGGK